MKGITISLNNKFEKELKKYKKKYKTLDNDFQNFVKIIQKIPTGNKSRHWNILKQDNNKYIFKTRMMCRAVKGSSFRVIYYYDGEKIELIFLEIYFKGKKEKEDQRRIESIWKEKQC